MCGEFAAEMCLCLAEPWTLAIHAIRLNQVHNYVLGVKMTFVLFLLSALGPEVSLRTF